LHRICVWIAISISLGLMSCGMLSGEISPNEKPPPKIPPKEFLYQNTTFDIDLNTPISTQLPQLTEGIGEQAAGVKYSVDPAFPAGISVDEDTGEISGVPTESLKATVFTITAENELGSTQAQITIEVDFVAPNGALLADIAPGSDDRYGSNLTPFAVADDYVIVQATEGLLISDYTTQGTFVIDDLSPNFCNDCLAVDGNTVIYGAANSDGYFVPHVSDGTREGTKIIKTINPSGHSIATGYFTLVDHKVVFFGDDGSSGVELYVTDGTEAGTQRIKDVNSGPGGQTANPGIVLGNLAIFYLDGGNGMEPWVTDGSEVGTKELADINLSGDSKTYFGTAQGELYCRTGDTIVFSANDGTENELWRTDGTPAGTQQVLDINGATDAEVGYLVCVPGEQKAIFTAKVGATYSIFSTDGTSGGTVELDSGYSNKNSDKLGSCNDKAYFKLRFAGGDDRYFQTDGTLANTDAWPYTSELKSISFKDYCFFYEDGKIYKTDGTLSGTSAISDDAGASFKIYGTNSNVMLFKGGGSGPALQTWNGDVGGFATLEQDELSYATDAVGVKDERILFIGKVYSGEKLYSTYGDSANTIVMLDLGGLGYGSEPGSFTSVNNKIVFAATDPDKGRELFTTDLTSKGTVVLKDIHPDGDSDPKRFVVMGDYALFLATTPDEGEELWRTDGTESGTFLVKDIRAGAEDSNINNMTNIDGTLYFSATTEAVATEPWKSDGTEAGTALVKDINASGSSATRNFVKAGAWIYFIARPSSNTHDRELWRTDGTSANTQRAYDFNSTGYDGINALTAIGSDVYVYGCSSADNNDGIIKFDGTNMAFIQDLDDLLFMPGCINIMGFYFASKLDNINGNLLITYDDMGTKYGEELFLYEVNTTTMRFLDFYPGGGDGYEGERDAQKHNNKAYFGSVDSSAAYFRVTDGTLAGTQTLGSPSNTAFDYRVNSLFEYSGEIYLYGTSYDKGTFAKTTGLAGSLTEIAQTDWSETFDGAKPVLLDNTIVYQNCDDDHGCELWGLTLD
jgi:ELWxxDGT repeat protein